MKAVITIGFDEYLVGDAKKALALVELLKNSTRVARHVGYEPDTLRLSSEPVRAEMRTVPATTKILPEKGKKA